MTKWNTCHNCGHSFPTMDDETDDCPCCPQLVDDYDDYHCKGCGERFVTRIIYDDEGNADEAVECPNGCDLRALY